MAPKSVLLLLLVAVATTLAQKPCCYPDQLEGDLATVTAYVEAGRGMVLTSSYQLAYDYTNRRVAVINYREDMGELTKFQTIFLYNKGVEYDIQVKSAVSACSKRTLKETIPHCIPSNATSMGSSYFGDHKLNVDFFKFFESSGPTSYGNVSLTVSQGDCIPVSSVIEGVSGNVPNLSIRSIVNVTKSISDPSKYFTVPDFCKQADLKEPKQEQSPFLKVLP